MMSVKRPVSWFLTDRGRSFTSWVIAGTGITLTSAKFFSHTFLLDKYKEFVHLYSNSQPVELPKELTDRFEKCMDLLKIPDQLRKLTSPFSICGFDLFNAGTCVSKFGAIVGIPVNFTFKNIDDVKKEDIVVNLKSVEWDSETGQKLADALILPEKVQLFGLCREILMTQNYKVYLESAYPFLCIFAAYKTAQFVNNRLRLYSAPLMTRIIPYTILSTFYTGVYFLLKDYTQVHYETSVDKKLTQLGPEFVESGVTFYEKLIKRNQALRELMGPEGEQKYTKLGNENFLIRQPRIQLVHRKQYFLAIMKGESLEDVETGVGTPNIA